MTMAYSDFDLRTALRTFGLNQQHTRDLFARVPPIVPSCGLTTWLDEFVPVATGINNEQARREFIIAPVLVEAHRRSTVPVTLLPGASLDVDRERGLTGYCDYLITRGKQHYFVTAPVLVVIEAKREDLIAGLGQCA
ncbi:MAG: hypothetical protein ACRCZF_27870, partial [Gemmataceae bacterium]